MLQIQTVEDDHVLHVRREMAVKLILVASLCKVRSCCPLLFDLTNSDSPVLQASTVFFSALLLEAVASLAFASPCARGQHVTPP